MSNVLAEVKTSYVCPVCGNALLKLAALPRFAAPCSECGSYLWCRRRSSDEGVVLEALSGRSPEVREIAMVVDSLSRDGPLDRVTLDLSELVVVHSSFLAALVAMKKRVQASGGRLYLCGLQPIVREIFDQIRFDRIFDIVDW